MKNSATFANLPLNIDLQTEPEFTAVDLMAAGEHSDEHFVLSVDITEPGPDSQLIRWQLRRRDGGKFKVTNFKVEAAVPGIDLHRMFVPRLHDAIGKLDLISLPWGLNERSFASWAFPLIAALNRNDENRFCMGFMDHVHTADAGHGCYDEDAKVSLKRLYDQEALETDVWQETLYLSWARRHILDEVRVFSRAYDQVNQPVLCATPPVAWEPVWCSWYGVKNDIDADYITAMAPLLAEWGFGSAIVDAGWFRDDGFDEQTGHYVPVEEKFPDLKAMVEEVQSHGLKILLWCSPLFNVGGIQQEPFIKRNLKQGEGTVHSFLCPQVREVREYTARMVGHLMRTYGNDGLKIDFIDPLQADAANKCTAEHEHDIVDYGEAIEATLAAIHDAMKAVRPDALIEYRMNYANLLTRRFATSHRAQDAPFDFDHIRRMCTRLKSYIIDPQAGMEGNVAVHTDPAYWLPAEPLDNVARFMASLAVSGVPMLSTDLRTLPEAQRPIVQNWLKFYRENKELLLFGTQRFLSADPHYSLFSMHRGETALWSVFTESFPGELQVPGEGVGHMWILNGSLQERIYSRLTGVEGERLALRVYDRALEEKSGAELPVEGGVVLLDIEMETGGALELLVERK